MQTDYQEDFRSIRFNRLLGFFNRILKFNRSWAPNSVRSFWKSQSKFTAKKQHKKCKQAHCPGPQDKLWLKKPASLCATPIGITNSANGEVLFYTPGELTQFSSFMLFLCQFHIMEQRDSAWEKEINLAVVSLFCGSKTKGPTLWSVDRPKTMRGKPSEGMLWVIREIGQKKKGARYYIIGLLFISIYTARRHTEAEYMCHRLAVAF